MPGRKPEKPRRFPGKLREIPGAGPPFPLEKGSHSLRGGEERFHLVETFVRRRKQDGHLGELRYNRNTNTFRAPGPAPGRGEARP